MSPSRYARVALGFVAGLTLAMLSCGLAHSAPDTYTLVDLGQTVTYYAAALAKDATIVVGQAGSNAHAIQLYPTVVDFGTTPGTSASVARGTGHDRSVGASGHHGFLRTPDGVMHDLGTTTGNPALFSEALATNAEDVVGHADNTTQTGDVAVIWVGSTAIMPLPTLGGVRGYADAINDPGTTVGVTQTATGASFQCAVWPKAGGVVSCHAAGAYESVGTDINTAGQVVGYALYNNLAVPQRAFVWLPLTGAILLDPLPGDNRSSAYSINDAGDIVGRSSQGDSNHGVFWANGTPVSLQARITAPGWTLGDLLRINNEGAILATAGLAGVGHYVLLLPNATITTPPPRAIPPAPVAFQAAFPSDMNGDGILDQVGLDYLGKVWLCLGGQSACNRIPGTLETLATGDFNRDGKTDLVGMSGGALWITTTPAQGWRHVPGPVVRSVATGDFNRDGQTDIVGLDHDGTVWMSTDAHLATPTWHWVAGWFGSLTAADLDGDGQTDLIGLATAGASPYLYGTVWITLQANRQIPYWGYLPGYWLWPQGYGPGPTHTILAWNTNCWYQFPLGGTSWSVVSCPG